MAKAPRPGHVKTRLVPPLSHESAVAISAGFLRDITENIQSAARHAAISGYVAYAPAGSETLFDGMLAAGTGLILADGTGEFPPEVRGFGRCLLHAARELFLAGHDAACLLNSDSPTLPTALLRQTAEALAAPGDRIVLGPAEDGGYYLIGMKTPHARLFADIAWSTDAVAEQTRERAREIGLDVVELAPWYDVDDVGGLDRLVNDLASSHDARDPLPPYPAPATAACLDRLGLTDRLEVSVPPRGALMSDSNLAIGKRYFEAIDDRRPSIAESPPVCIYLEVTNRCNLLCETCPRTFEDLEPPADMSWALFTSIIDQVPGLARVVLHGVGEPMLVKDLPRMIRYLKSRGIYVLFNTNGTLLAPRKRLQIIETGLDELRVSLDAADAANFLKVRGKDMFDRIVRNVSEFTALQKEIGATNPRVSLWLTGLKETIDELPDFVRLAARIGVKEVHLQRLVFDDLGRGLARADSSLFERTQRAEEDSIAAAQELGRELGVMIDASGATEPGLSLKRERAESPWSACRRPWSLMYFTAHGRALPCCIAPFSTRGYENYTLGDATQQTLREIWNGDAYRQFRAALTTDAPPKPCQNCGLRWSL